MTTLCTATEAAWFKHKPLYTNALPNSRRKLVRNSDFDVACAEFLLENNTYENFELDISVDDRNDSVQIFMDFCRALPDKGKLRVKSLNGTFYDGQVYFEFCNFLLEVGLQNVYKQKGKSRIYCNFLNKYNSSKRIPLY